MNDINDAKVIKTLNSLIQLDVDAVGAYSRAIDEIDFSEAKQQLTRFRADHEHHIDDLSREVRSLGGIPTENKRDLKGFFLEGFTAIRSKTGTEGALKAMKTNEELTNKTYEKALQEQMPPSALAIVRRNRADEARHLEYITRMLETRPWETRKAG